MVPSFNDMVVKACALALGDFPRANAAYRDGKLELYSRINVGVAVAAREALVVPTIFDADRRACVGSPRESRALAARVREQTITPPELSGGTFTVSNLGMYGVANFHAVINPPQAAIFAVGAITERRWSATASSPARSRWAPPSPAITGSSTAPTAPSFWAGCGRCWRSRSGSRCE